MNRPKSNFAQIVLALCAVATLIIAFFNSINFNEITESKKEVLKVGASTNVIKSSSPEKMEDAPISKEELVLNPDKGNTNKSTPQPTVNNNEVKLTLAVEHLLSDTAIMDDEFEKLVSEKKFELALEALKVAEIKASKKNTLSMIDNRRKSIYLIIEKDFDNAWFSFPGTLILTEKDGLRGLYNRNGQEVCPPKFNLIDPIAFDELYCTDLNGMYGFFNKKGEEIFPPIFDDIEPSLFAPLILVEKEGVYGFIDQKGNTIYKPFFEEMERAWSDLIFVKRENKWGAMDFLGKMVLDLKYDEIVLLEENIIYVKENKENIYFNKKGRRIKNPAFN